MTGLKENISWIAPILMALLVGGYQLWASIDKIEKMSVIQEEGVRGVYHMECRISRLEEFCCEEMTTNKCR